MLFSQQIHWGFLCHSFFIRPGRCRTGSAHFFLMGLRLAVRCLDQADSGVHSGPTLPLWLTSAPHLLAPPWAHGYPGPVLLMVNIRSTRATAEVCDASSGLGRWLSFCRCDLHSVGRTSLRLCPSARATLTKHHTSVA